MELIAVVPFVLLAGLVVWQLVLAGHAAWATANAARVGARADLVGADVDQAVRSALSARLERGLSIREEDGRVAVRVELPLVGPWSAAGPVFLAASARMGGTS